MRRVTCSLGVSLDGYVTDRDGGLGWSVPDEDVFRAATDELRRADVHLMGRRLYETMLYWETADDDPALDDAERTWTALWKPLPKVVFSTTLTEVQGTARLATDDLLTEVARLRAEPGDGEIAIGGATLAHQVAAAGLVDEYRLRVHPVVLGGGLPYFARDARREDLTLVEQRTFPSGVVTLRYRTGAR